MDYDNLTSCEILKLREELKKIDIDYFILQYLNVVIKEIQNETNEIIEKYNFKLHRNAHNSIKLIHTLYKNEYDRHKELTNNFKQNKTFYIYLQFKKSIEDNKIFKPRGL
jgi:ADP-heptose:LPS heptosyltransferase